MVRITLDPDEVNQAAHVTLTDGTVVDLAAVDKATLDRIARQLHVHRSSYLHAFEPADTHVRAQVDGGEVTLDEVAPLYVKVAALQRRSRPAAGRAAEQLDLAILLQTRVWTSSSGVTQDLRDLTPTHRRNLIAWLERNTDALERRFAAADLSAEQRQQVVAASPWVAGTPVYRRLAELIAAESARERAMDQARQVARSLEFGRSGNWPDR
jgi:hypothetical protein